MHNDNVYPRNGQAYVPTVPEEQKEAQQKSLNEVLEELPLLKRELARLDKQIAHYSSIQAIPAELETKPDEYMHYAAGNRRAVDVLTKERNYITARVLNTRAT